MTIDTELESTSQPIITSPKKGATAQMAPMKSSALTGVLCCGCSLANHAGSIPELAMAHMRREAPMRKAFHEVSRPASPPATTRLPQNSPDRAAIASAVTRSKSCISDAGSARPVVMMMAT